tara:strand:- start:10280 stop:15343 length:5064 start_codon:yes stop_codon:yes gene_type:complete
MKEKITLKKQKTLQEERTKKFNFDASFSRPKKKPKPTASEKAEINRQRNVQKTARQIADEAKRNFRGQEKPAERCNAASAIAGCAKNLTQSNALTLVAPDGGSESALRNMPTGTETETQTDNVINVPEYNAIQLYQHFVQQYIREMRNAEKNGGEAEGKFTKASNEARNNVIKKLENDQKDRFETEVEEGVSYAYPLVPKDMTSDQTYNFVNNLTNDFHKFVIKGISVDSEEKEEDKEEELIRFNQRLQKNPGDLPYRKISAPRGNDQKHIELIKKSLEEAGAFDNNCFADFQENVGDYLFLTAAWAALATTINDIVAEIPKQIADYHKSAKELNRMHRAAMDDIASGLKPDAGSKHWRLQDKMRELNQIVPETMLKKLKLAIIKFATVLRVAPGTAIAQAVWELASHALIALRQVYRYAAAITGLPLPSFGIPGLKNTKQWDLWSRLSRRFGSVLSKEYEPDFKVDSARGRVPTAAEDVVDGLYGFKKILVSSGGIAALIGLSSLQSRINKYHDQRAIDSAGGSTKSEASKNINALMQYLRSETDQKKTEQAKKAAFSEKGFTTPDGQTIKLYNFEKKATGKEKAKEEYYEEYVESVLELDSMTTTFGLYLQQLLATVAIIDLTPELLLPNYFMFDFDRNCANTVALPLGIMAAFPLSSAYRRYKTTRGDPKRGLTEKSLVETEIDTIRSSYVDDIEDTIISSQRMVGVFNNNEGLRNFIVTFIHAVEKIVFHKDILALAREAAGAAGDLTRVNQIIVRLVDNIDFTKPGFKDILDTVKKMYPDRSDQFHKQYAKNLIKDEAVKTAKTITDQFNVKYKEALNELGEVTESIPLAQRQARVLKDEIDSIGSMTREGAGRSATLSGASGPTAAQQGDAVEIVLDFSKLDVSESGSSTLIPAPKNAPKSFGDDLDDAFELDDTIDLDQTVEMPAPVPENIKLPDELDDSLLTKLDDADDTVVMRALGPMLNGNKIDITLYHEIVMSNKELVKNLTDDFLKRAGIDPANASAADKLSARSQAYDQIEVLELIRKMSEKVKSRGDDAVVSTDDVFPGRPRANELDPAWKQTFYWLWTFATWNVPNRLKNLFQIFKRAESNKEKAFIVNSLNDFINDGLDRSLAFFGAGRALDDVTQAKIDAIKGNIENLINTQAKKLDVIPQNLGPAAWARWADDIPLTIAKTIVFIAFLEQVLKLFNYGISMVYDGPCAEIENKIKNPSKNSKVTQEDLTTFIECSIEEKVLFGSNTFDYTVRASQDLTSFFAQSLASFFGGPDKKEFIANTRAEKKKKEVETSREVRAVALWQGSLIREFLVPGNNSISAENEVSAYLQFRKAKILSANFIFNRDVQKRVLASLAGTQEKPKYNTIGDLIEQRDKTDKNERRNLLYQYITLSHAQEYPNDNKYLDAFISAMGPHDSDDREKKGLKLANDPTRPGYGYLKNLSEDQKKLAIEQIRIVVLTMIQASDIENVIDDLVTRELLNVKALSGSTGASTVFAQALEKGFQQITDPDAVTIPPNLKPEDVRIRYHARPKANRVPETTQFIIKDGDQLESSPARAYYENLMEIGLNIDEGIKTTAAEKTIQVQKESVVGREYLSNMVRNMLLEFSYGQGYSPYPYHSDIGEEQEEAPDFMQDWKDFELSLVRDESRNTAIEVAKILVKDLELFGDVVDLVGKNQSVATEILKNLKKKK